MRNKVNANTSRPRSCGPEILVFSPAFLAFTDTGGRGSGLGWVVNREKEKGAIPNLLCCNSHFF